MIIFNVTIAEIKRESADVLLKMIKLKRKTEHLVTVFLEWMDFSFLLWQQFYVETATTNLALKCCPILFKIFEKN